VKVPAAVRTLVYVIVFVLGWGWLARAAQQLDRHLGLQLPSWLQPLGYLVAAAGTVLVLVCLFAFAWRGRGTPAPFDAPRELIIWGPYRLVRNPIYVGVVAVLGGIALALRSPSALLLAVAAWLLAHALVVLYEEPTLRRRFGASYERYVLEVNRWLPWRPRPGGA
jgi:protein-S-isoprenylcysteine O-methyltransferase Ste14